MAPGADITSAAAASAERARRRARGSGVSRVLALALMAVFFVALMMGLVSGAAVYRSVAGAQARAKDLTLQSGLIQNAVRVNDAIAAVGEAAGPEGPALVLAQEAGGERYETRLYLYRGNVVQEYVPAGRDINPSGAEPLLESSTFDFDYSNCLVSVTTDAGTFREYVRSAAGPAGEGEGVAADGPAPGEEGPAVETIADEAEQPMAGGAR